MKWKFFPKKNSSVSSRKQAFEDYEKDYISRLKQDVDAEFESV